MDHVTCTNCGVGNETSSKYCKQCGYELPKPEPEIFEVQPEPATVPWKDRKKRLIGSIGFIIAFGLSYWAVQKIFFKPPSFNKVMMEIASELNKTCPIMIDAETRLDNAIALPPNTFQYNYTLVNIDEGTIDTTAMKNYLEPSIVNNVKTNPQMKMQRDSKTTMNYYYKDKNGQYLFIVSVTPDKYQ